MKLFLLANTDLVCFTLISCSPSNAVIWIILVFMSPETLQVREWRSVLSGKGFKKQVVLVAVDEAHCISEWLECVSSLSLICMHMCFFLVGDKALENHLT